ncbi:MAG: anaerobic ribonucleoside-triphosphate reductase, partial [Candidatus Thermoplasmatota archaeon]|nr:anaerobic ribonucleoside-triphosphate reductase [Candidatus Thermoplasmatota archaeon]
MIKNKDDGYRPPKKEDNKDSTELALFVKSSSDDIQKWDKTKIYDALVRETDIAPDAARVVAVEVEKMIMNSNIQMITAPLVRELTNAKLIEYGLEHIRRQHTRLGVPIYDAENIIIYPNKENANVPHNPEATNLTLAENIKKEYALLKVFSQDVGDAHMRGDIHLHDLGFIDRPYCSGQSLEYVKKFGLDLPNALAIAKPAKHPEVLLGQMVKFSAALQGNFNGAIGWDAVNLFFAPYLVEKTDKEIKQLAQMLIFEYSQQAVARGGQAIFSDINLYWEVPKHFREVPAIGPGGQYTGKTYADYLPESQRFINAIFDVYKDGDAVGRPFFFPKPLLHITDQFFKTPGNEEFMNKICDVASEKGHPYFVFDRGDTAKISECCRLAFQLRDTDLLDAKEPWRMRYSALQNVTMNLPRMAYLARGDESKLFERMDEVMEIVVKAHKQKKAFIEKLLALGPRSPLSMLVMNRDGQPYLRMWRVTYLVGMLGLNELVQAHMGQQLHESKDALRFGLKVIAYMNQLTKKHSKEADDLHFVLEQTPAESTAYRMAKLDMRHYPLQTAAVIKGMKETGEIYYTNSTYLNVSEKINPIDRVKTEGLFHPLIEAGALTHVWLGEARPTAESVANFVKKTFTNTQ